MVVDVQQKPVNDVSSTLSLSVYLSASLYLSPSLSLSFCLPVPLSFSSPPLHFNRKSNSFDRPEMYLTLLIPFMYYWCLDLLVAHLYCHAFF